MKAVVPAVRGQQGAIPAIRPDRCTECIGHFTWPRCAALCPVSAIRRDPGHLETHVALLSKWFSLTGRDVYEFAEPRALEPAVDIGEAGD